MKNDKELRKKLSKYNNFELIDLCISTRKQVSILKRDNEIMQIEIEYWKSEYNKIVSRIKDISKELILVKKELLELKDDDKCQKK